MALLVFEDFKSPIDYLADSDLVFDAAGVDGNQVAFGPYGEGGTRGARCRDDNWGRITVDVGQWTPTTIIFGWRARYTGQAPPTNAELVCVEDSAGGRILELEGTASSEFQVINAAGTNIGTTTGAQINGGSYQFYEMKLVVGTGANGTLELRVNGATVFSVTGQDFTDGNDDVGRIWLSGHNTSDYLYLDRVQCLDGTGTVNNDWLGEIIAEYVMPDGDGNQTDWTPDTGTTNYTQVDEATGGGGGRNDADYVQAGTEGNLDLYTYGALVSDADPIAVDLIPYLTLPDGGSRFIRPVARISAVNYTGTTRAVATAMGNTMRFEQSPATSSAWTAAEVNGAEFGYEVRDS